MKFCSKILNFQVKFLSEICRVFVDFILQKLSPPFLSFQTYKSWRWSFLIPISASLPKKSEKKKIDREILEREKERGRQ